MTQREEPLTPQEEALLAYSLGLSEELPGDAPTTSEAAALRELVSEARGSARREAPRTAAVEAIQAAARRAAGETSTPSIWTQLEGGLKRSLLLRLVAASLVIHLAALPVLAWLHFSQPERPPLWIHFEEPPPVLTSEPQPELLEPIELPEVLELADPTELEDR